MNASLRELAQRERDGLEVTLYWDSSSDQVSIEVVDQRAENGFRVPVAASSALDAFHHPYAYAPIGARVEIASAKSAQVTS